MRKLFVVLACSPMALQAQSLDYRWPNQPCAQVLSCDTGCTACNLPDGNSAVLLGTNLGAVGVDVCPHPVELGDNALFTFGWPVIADNDHKLLISGLAFQPLHIDSVIVRHRSGSDGPERLRVSISVNGAAPELVSDVYVQTMFTLSTFTDVGVVAAPEGNVSGMFQIELQAYQGSGGNWDLDEVRIVTSPATLTGISELNAPRYSDIPRYDLLGRPAPRTDIDGVFFDRSKRIRVQ
ncbi:MAG: hypothetical protein IT229_03195 [Flavobacteriales bacterium]|nr:hypothetical protein [Flavobacteriales bacterium]